VKLTNAGADASTAAILARLEKLERAVAGGAAAPRRPGSPETPSSTADPTAPVGRPSGTGASPRARLGSAVTAPAEPLPDAAPAAPPPEAAPDEPSPAVQPATSTAPAPDRDQLTLAWADQILPRLSRQAKPVLAAGRWVTEGDGVALAVPNEPHRQRSEQHRGELEAALAAHFHRTVPVVFVLDQPGGERPRPQDVRTPARAPEPEEAVDPAELVDAGPEHDVAPIERLTRAFPGAEIVEET
jgi:DNA polymerase-3 subunit gamma/tau